jgi:predicted transcriptional regulator
MFKTEVITFRTSRELKEFLDRAGRDSKRSRSSLIEAILRDFLAVKEGGLASPEDSGVMRPSAGAAKGGDNGEEMKTLMLGGVRITVPNDLPVKISFDEGAASFRIELASRETIEVAVPRPALKEF